MHDPASNKWHAPLQTQQRPLREEREPRKQAHMATKLVTIDIVFNDDLLLT